jgi:hypothetical protein
LDDVSHVSASPSIPAEIGAPQRTDETCRETRNYGDTKQAAIEAGSPRSVRS